MRDKYRTTMAVRDRNLVPTDAQKNAMAAYLAKHEGKPVVVEISKPASVRSVQQNRYLWGVVYQTIAEHTGHSTEEIHMAVKNLFLPRKFIALGSREVEISKTTTELDTAEFSHYIEQVRAWAAQELRCSIPSANE